MGELGQGQVGVVAAGDRVEDAPLIEGLDDAGDARPEANLFVFEQDTVPKGIVEVPDKTFDERPLKTTVFAGQSG